MPDMNTSTWWTTMEGAVTYAHMIGPFGTIRLANGQKLHVDLHRDDAPEEELIRDAMTKLRARTRKGAPRGPRPRIKVNVTKGTVAVIRNLSDGVTNETRFYVTALEVLS